MLVNIDWMRSNFQKYNDLLWDGRLSMPEFKISMSKSYWGTTSIKRSAFFDNQIEGLVLMMSNYLDSPESVFINTLVHEMIHVADYTFNPSHAFQSGYRAHGKEFFKPECERIKKLTGIVITTRATEAECKSCKISAKAKQKEKDIKERSNYYAFFRYRDEFAKKHNKECIWSIRKINENHLERLKREVKTGKRTNFNAAYESIEVYYGTNKTLVDGFGTRKCSYTVQYNVKYAVKAKAQRGLKLIKKYTIDK